MILHLGVIDQPYAQPPPARRRRRKIAAGNQTTGDVATWLENRYHVMEVFFQQNQQGVASDLEESLSGALENLLMGAPTSIDAFGSATSKIEDRLKQFIVQGDMEKLGYPGVPTQAALDRRSGKRRSARFKGRRPGTGVSFVDSGLYQASIKAWIA